MLSEMNEMYYESVKTSIADYVMLNQEERRRLQVTVTPVESALERRINFVFGEMYLAPHPLPIFILLCLFSPFKLTN